MAKGKFLEFMTLNDFEIPDVPGKGKVVLPWLKIEIKTHRGKLQDVGDYEYDTRGFTDEQLDYIDTELENDLLVDEDRLREIWGEFGYDVDPHLLYDDDDNDD